MMLKADLHGPISGLFTREMLDEVRREESTKWTSRDAVSRCVSMSSLDASGGSSDETMEWLNFLIKQIWPHLARNIESMIRGYLPTLQALAPSPLGTLAFETCQVGDETMKLGPIKGRSVPAHYDEKTIPNDGVELQIGVNYKSNIDVVLRTAVARVGLANLSLNGEVSIFLRPLIDEPPFIGGMEVVFTNPPKINVEFRGIAGVAEVPGLKRMVFEAINGAVAKAIVVPNRKSFVISSDPKVDAALLKCPLPIGVMRVAIVQAANLIASDVTLRGRSSDPYVRVRVGAQVWKTPTIQKNLNPRWTTNNVHDFLVYSDCQFAIMDVFDEDKGPLQSDDFLGKVVCDITRLRAGTKALMHEFLEMPQGHTAKRSELIFEAQWLNQSESLQGPELEEGPSKYLLDFKVDEIHGLSYKASLGSPYTLRARAVFSNTKEEPTATSDVGHAKADEVTVDLQLLDKMRKLLETGVDPALVEDIMDVDTDLVQKFMIEFPKSNFSQLKDQRDKVQPWLEKVRKSREDHRSAVNPQFEEVLRLLLPSRQGHLEVELLSDPVARKKSKIPEVLRHFQVDFGQQAVIKGPFTLHAECVSLVVIGAKGLPAADLNGFSDPYVVIETVGKPKKPVGQTPVINKTLDPTWNHQVDVWHMTPKDGLVFLVYDKDLMGSDFLGKAVLPAINFWESGFDGLLKLEETKGKDSTLRVRVDPVAADAKLHGSLTLQRLEEA